MISAIISRLVILVFGTLYPAYASYKAVRTKNLKEYVKWMMYWIVFALFTCTETFTDVFLSWFPFYYEVKIVLVLWLLSPATKGSSILYRKFVHPALCRREQEIDEYIAKAKDQGYHTVLNLGTKGVNYATTVIMQTAIKGGGGLVQQLRKSYSLSDLSECEPREERSNDEADDVLTEPRLVRRTTKGGYNTRRSASESNSRSPIYFPEVDVELRSGRAGRTAEPDFSHIKSTEDISSGYSSADNSASLTRTASLGAAARAKARSTRTTVTTIKRPQAAEGNEVIIEELLEDDTFDYANMPPLVNLSSPLYLSHTDPPFIYQYVGDQVKIIEVLGNYPLDRNFNNHKTDNPDQWDQNDATTKNTSTIPDPEQIETNKHLKTEVNANDLTSSCPDNTNVESDTTIPVVNKINKLNHSETDSAQIIDEDCKVEQPNLTKENIRMCETITIQTTFNTENYENENENLKVDNNANDPVDSTLLDTSLEDNDSAESDDEASFSTPQDSPKNKRKSPRGRYGKGKAPLPPATDNAETSINKYLEDTASAISTTSQESLVDIVKNFPNTEFKQSGTFKGLQVVNPIAEKKRRHKSKSPAKIPRGNISSIGKLLQLPGKLAFWNKAEDKPKDTTSTSSGDRSRRSSTTEKGVDEFQSCSHLDTLLNVDNVTTDKSQIEIVEDKLSFQDATDFETESMSLNIIEKSDALQKLINAKLESHPEYKFVSLHEDTSTIKSKSTDV